MSAAWLSKSIRPKSLMGACLAVTAFLTLGAAAQQGKDPGTKGGTSSKTSVETLSDTKSQPTATVDSRYAAGSKVYAAKCASCHGSNGTSSIGLLTGKNTTVASLGSNAVQSKSNAELTKVIADGQGKMPAFKGKLTEEQINDLVSYIRTMRTIKFADR